MAVVPARVPSIADLTEASTLSALLDRAVDRVETMPLQHGGFSDAVLWRVVAVAPDDSRDRFILKRVRAGEWTARRTGATLGREALLLGEPLCGDVWKVFDCPYVAYAVEESESALLMRDLSAGLLPDQRAPLEDEQELALLGALSQLHAAFWNRVPAVDWLARPSNYCDMVAPSLVSEAGELDRLPHPLRAVIERGWAVALERLPGRCADLLTSPGKTWELAWSDLPRTLLHGDAKVANFALTPEGRVAAFDWTGCGSGPCTIDLGWYLGVNASRLTSTRESTIARYRKLLAAASGNPIADAMWERLESVAIVAGARMLLWNKAFALESGRAGAESEWQWWVDRLTILT